MRPHTARRALIGLLAAAGLLVGTASSAHAQESGPTATKAATSAQYAKHYFDTVVSQWTHWSPNALNSTHAGNLWVGTNYFYCQTPGATYAHNGRQDSIWLLTDDDSGNKNVYVSDVNLDDAGWRSFGRILPAC
ncbi:hypothetical protein [Actinoplanes sp. NPDC051411]|uniref:hypothetical protein n=1 Tax=Actinoplanes sp. NPDC051411 TaxID=3155522 RepID=UPI00343E976E